MAKKPGPKTEVPDDMERVTLTLDPMTRRRLRVLGQSNESLGARVAARVAFDRYQRSVDGQRTAPWPTLGRAALITWLRDAAQDDPNHPAGQAAALLGAS